MTKHLRPLYNRRAHIDGKPMSRVLVDNGAAVNILPLRIVRRLSKPGERKEDFQIKKECNEVKSTLTFGALEYKFRKVIPVWNCSIYRMGGGKDRIEMGTKYSLNLKKGISMKARQDLLSTAFASAKEGRVSYVPFRPVQKKEVLELELSHQLDQLTLLERLSASELKRKASEAKTK
ncbi:hypothetical protein ACH5RR_039292 [Cinchona calisaya]|uniref:Uncharacterized protein n=1 Tax=Cinchona calisaya TaxID=153742 RepID=A0ABD2Y1A3_9GENT